MELRTADAGRGASWLLDGFDYFKKDAGVWIGTTILLFVISLVLGIIPLGGLALNLVSPALLAGLMLGCRAVDEGRSLELGHLFAAFSNRTGELLGLGALYVLALICIVVVMALVLIASLGTQVLTQMQSGDMAALTGAVGSLALVLLVGAAIYLPVLMALWFAPALMVFSNLSITQALGTSFRACLANIVPFLVYGIVGLLLSIVATIPFMLGWLILFPMVVASIYIAYKDIFPQAPAA